MSSYRPLCVCFMSKESGCAPLLIFDRGKLSVSDAASGTALQARHAQTHIITAFMQIDSEVTADGRFPIEVELLSSPRTPRREPRENNIDLFPIAALLCSAHYIFIHNAVLLVEKDAREAPYCFSLVLDWSTAFIIPIRCFSIAFHVFDRNGCCDKKPIL